MTVTKLLSYVASAMRRLCSAKVALGLGAVLIVGLVLAATLNPWNAEAQQPPFDCPSTENVLQLPIGKCAFVNFAVHPVNDIHIAFDGLVLKLSSSPASSCRLRLLLPRQGGFKSVYNCRFGLGRGSSNVQPFETFSMTVLNLNTQHPNGAHIDSWYWTVNGTPVTITPTGTATPTDTPTPEPAETPPPDDRID